MFSSNQVLAVSGSFGQLKNSLEFALNMYGGSKDVKYVYQITDDGRYCVGRVYDFYQNKI